MTFLFEASVYSSAKRRPGLGSYCCVTDHPQTSVSISIYSDPGGIRGALGSPANMGHVCLYFCSWLLCSLCSGSPGVASRPWLSVDWAVRWACHVILIIQRPSLGFLLFAKARVPRVWADTHKASGSLLILPHPVGWSKSQGQLTFKSWGDGLQSPTERTRNSEERRMAAGRAGDWLTVRAVRPLACCSTC